MPFEIRVLVASDAALLDHVALEVFDKPIDQNLTKAFFADPRHHLVVAVDDGVVVGMASAVDYIHPDKPRQLWINEVGVAPSHQRRGIGRHLLAAILDHGRHLECTEAWVTTEVENAPACSLYESVGGTAEACVLYSFPLNAENGNTNAG